MGVGNYTEEDIKECSRAFTGWTIGNTEYMVLRAARDSIWPYGRIAWHFQYRPEDHDDGEKVFLGHRGRFNGEDIIDIICQHPATARFLSRHLYHFFVADEPPVPSVAPIRRPGTRRPSRRCPSRTSTVTTIYPPCCGCCSTQTSSAPKTHGTKRSRAQWSWWLGCFGLHGNSPRPAPQILDRTMQIRYMGQELINPPSVEGWHQGVEWIDTGTLVERLNFATQQLGDMKIPGARAMVGEVLASGGEVISPESLVDGCLDQMGRHQGVGGNAIGAGRVCLTWEATCTWAPKDQMTRPDREWRRFSRWWRPPLSSSAPSPRQPDRKPPCACADTSPANSCMRPGFGEGAGRSRT